MTDTPKDATGQRDRSPAFPVIALEPALTKLTEFEAHYKRVPGRPEKVGEAWNIKTKSYADRIAAALRYFGLLEYQGSGKDRSIVVSEIGRKYLRAQQEELKREIIKTTALRPKQIAKHWNDWGADRPADAACLDALMDEGFSDGGARDFLKVYDATITYAKLSDSDKAVLEEGENDDESELSGMTPQEHTPPNPRTGTQHVPPTRLPMDNPPLGKPRIVMNGDHLDIHASVDLAGLKQLQTMLKKYEEILQMMAPADEEAAN